MNGASWQTVVEGIAALGLLIVLIRLTSPARLKPGPGRSPALAVTEVGVSVALAAVLSLIRVYRMPQGGSISLEMVPIFYIALRRGAGTGILAGLVLGIVKLMLEPYIVHPLQFVMDYPLAFGVLGVAGLFRRFPLAGVLAGSSARFVLHLLSGVAFFASYAPEGANVWAYSAGYNASYMVPETIIAAIVMTVLGVRAVRGTGRSPARKFQ